MGYKGNLGLLIFFSALLFAVVTMAQEPKRFERVKGINGLEKLIIRDPKGRSFEVYLFGGQVSSWKDQQGEELLVMSSKAIFDPPAAIRGGIPILFPQYSNIGPLPNHGFVRQRFWEIDENAPILQGEPLHVSWVNLILRSSPEDFKIWPHKFEYRMRIYLGAEGDLTMVSRIKNIDDKPFNFTIAFHPYIAVSDISGIQVEGLQNLNYLDQQKNRTRFTDNEKTITFNSHFDRIYLNTPNEIKVLDSKKNRTIVVHKEGQPDAVVWNPWDKKVVDLGVEDYKRFVTVESAAIEKPITVNAGQEWRGKLHMTVVPSKP